MRIAGVIAEYNPFHNGHLYQLAQIKDSLGVDAIVVVLSSSFTQRGIPGIFDQHLRAKMALSCGADVVLELPVVFSTGSAEYFAKGAVSLLDKLGVIDYLSFGSESGDITSLTSYAKSLLSISSAQELQIKNLLANGISYPEARSKALNLDNEILNNPNNILGIEYIKALLERNSSIKPTTLTRKGSYLEENLSEDNLSSAMAIRNALHSDEPVSSIKKHIPEAVYNLLLESSNYTPMFLDDFSDYLLYQLHMNINNGYSQFFDVGEALSNTFTNNIYKYKSFSSFVELSKSRNYTYTRINRALTHILLNIKQDFVLELCTNDYVQYARLLGFTSKGTDVLSSIKGNSEIPLISKISKSESQLNGLALASFQTDILASHIYQSQKAKKYNTDFKNEYSSPVIKS